MWTGVSDNLNLHKEKRSDKSLQAASSLKISVKRFQHYKQKETKNPHLREPSIVVLLIMPEWLGQVPSGQQQIVLTEGRLHVVAAGLSLKRPLSFGGHGQLDDRLVANFLLARSRFGLEMVLDEVAVAGGHKEGL